MLLCNPTCIVFSAYGPSPTSSTTIVARAPIATLSSPRIVEVVAFAHVRISGVRTERIELRQLPAVRRVWSSNWLFHLLMPPLVVVMVMLHLLLVLMLLSARLVQLSATGTVVVFTGLRVAVAHSLQRRRRAVRMTCTIRARRRPAPSPRLDVRCPPLDIRQLILAVALHSALPTPTQVADLIRQRLCPRCRPRHHAIRPTLASRCEARLSLVWIPSVRPGEAHPDRRRRLRAGGRHEECRSSVRSTSATTFQRPQLLLRLLLTRLTSFGPLETGVGMGTVDRACEESTGMNLECMMRIITYTFTAILMSA